MLCESPTLPRCLTLAHGGEARVLSGRRADGWVLAEEGGGLSEMAIPTPAEENMLGVNSTQEKFRLGKM